MRFIAAHSPDEALVLLHANGYLTDASPDLSGKFSFFTRDADVLAAKKRVAAARRSVTTAKKKATPPSSGTGGGKPPVIPPEVFKLIDEGDGDWRSRLTADDGADNALHVWVSYIQLAKNGHRVHVIKRSNEHKRKSPDIFLDEVPTEVKAPKGNSKNTISGNLRRAKRLSSQTIIDRHRTELTVDEIASYSRRELGR